MRSLHSAMKSSPRSPELEKARMQQRRPNAAKNKINFFLKKELRRTCGCRGRGMDWEFGISRYKVLYIEWINDRVLL